jgi:hypothetical protein
LRSVFFTILFCTATFAQAQRLAVKTNLLYDVTATANLGFEVALSKKITLDISGNYNEWDVVKGKQWRHFMVQPELRYWTCDHFNGHFFGLHALGGQHNVYGVELPFKLYPSLAEYNFRGYFVGGGLSYGYHWILGRRWSIEATVGAGYLHISFDKYATPDSGTKLDSGKENYIGPTKIGISIAYMIF